MKSRRKSKAPRKKKPRSIQVLTGTTKTTAQKRKKFLDSYSKMGNITVACEAAGIERSTHYAVWMNDPKYAVKFEEAKQEAGDRIEAEIFRRGHDGINKAIYYQGETIDVVKEYSDVLLIFFAKAIRPDKFREPNSFNLQGKIGDKKIDVSILQDAIKDAEA